MHGNTTFSYFYQRSNQYHQHRCDIIGCWSWYECGQQHWRSDRDQFRSEVRSSWIRHVSEHSHWRSDFCQWRHSRNCQRQHNQSHSGRKRCCHRQSGDYQYQTGRQCLWYICHIEQRQCSGKQSCGQLNQYHCAVPRRHGYQFDRNKHSGCEQSWSCQHRRNCTHSWQRCNFKWQHRQRDCEHRPRRYHGQRVCRWLHHVDWRHWRSNSWSGVC